MRKLIINADDLGISLEVNTQIEECIHRGVITSSTLLANSPAFEDGIRIAKQYPHISIGVHLNLIEYKPLTNADIFMRHGIVDDKGDFIEGAIFMAKVDEELKHAVFEEWDAQITMIEKAGIIPSHCDSHQHTHTITSLQEPLIRVLEKHRIRKVRRKIVPSILLMLRERNHPTVHLDKRNAITTKKRNTFARRLHLFFVIFDSLRWNRHMEKKFVMADSFYAFRYFHYDRSRLNLGKDSAVIELMCHPGHLGYQDETDKLMNNLSITTNGYSLISYNEI